MWYRKICFFVVFFKVIDQRLNGSPYAQAASQPAALWESSIWPLVKQNVTDHFCCGRLDEGTIAEKFHFDDREVLLQHLNLCPAKWTPDLTPQTHTHTPVACTGYFILTILGKNSGIEVTHTSPKDHVLYRTLCFLLCSKTMLKSQPDWVCDNKWSSFLFSGLNQKAAVDILFLPVVTLDDPRAAGVPHSHHDNSLLSCLTTGHVYVEPDGTCPDPGVFCLVVYFYVHIAHISA